MATSTTNNSANESSTTESNSTSEMIEAGQAKLESLLDQARSAIEGAVETTVDAVKEHPIAAAGIAAGAAAAVAGAAFGVSKLLEKDAPTSSKGATKH